MSHIYVSFSLIVSTSISDDPDQDSSAQMGAFITDELPGRHGLLCG